MKAGTSLYSARAVMARALLLARDGVRRWGGSFRQHMIGALRIAHAEQRQAVAGVRALQAVGPVDT
jgi:hypothetical protein